MRMKGKNVIVVVKRGRGDQFRDRGWEKGRERDRESEASAVSVKKVIVSVEGEKTCSCP